MNNYFLYIAIFVLVLILYYVPILLWVVARISGVRILLVEMVFMRIRKVPPALIVKALIAGKGNGIDLKKDELEAHFLAGGDLGNIMNGLLAAQKAGLKLSFKNASAADLNDINIVQAVESKLDNQKADVIFE